MVAHAQQFTWHAMLVRQVMQKLGLCKLHKNCLSMLTSNSVQLVFQYRVCAYRWQWGQSQGLST